MDELARLLIIASEISAAAHVQMQLSKRHLRESVDALTSNRNYAAYNSMAAANHAEANASALFKCLRKLRARIRTLRSHG